MPAGSPGLWLGVLSVRRRVYSYPLGGHGFQPGVYECAICIYRYVREDQCLCGYESLELWV